MTDHIDTPSPPSLLDPSYTPTLADFPSAGPGCVLETHRAFNGRVLTQVWYVRQDDLTDMERDRLFAEITGTLPLRF